MIYQIKKTNILLHIPIKYDADWYMNSQKLQHNYCDGDVLFSNIPYIKLKITNMVSVVLLKLVNLCTPGHKNVRKTIPVFISRHITFTNAYCSILGRGGGVCIRMWKVEIRG